MSEYDLTDLKAKGIPRMRAEDIFSIKEDSAEAQATMAKCDEYLQSFALVKDGKCIGCASPLCGSNVLDALSATFTWGLAHGEGFCRKCGYPARGYHHDLFEGFMPLQYHPDELIPRPDEAEDETPNLNG